VSKANPNSLSRDFAVQFLYQCEADKLFYFSEEHFQNFLSHFNVDLVAQDYLKVLSKGVLSNINSLDELISNHSKNWKITRMASTDRVILRIASFEILENVVPNKVILNEAIELAKKYGTEHSGAFVNGVLDAVLAGAHKA
jgi:transcription antitermination protein NusB